MILQNLRLIGNNIIEGIVVPFARREDDSYRTFWDMDTNFYEDVWSPQPLLGLHGLRGLSREGTVLQLEKLVDGLVHAGGSG